MPPDPCPGWPWRCGFGGPGWGFSDSSRDDEGAARPAEHAGREMARDLIDFQSERGRHEQLLGRQDVMAVMDGLLLRGSASRGWVLVRGGPGLGKSALLAEWLKRREQAGEPLPPHHFLRRGEEHWNRPEVVKRNLAAQVEQLYPKQTDPEAPPESRLKDLLQRVSSEVLQPYQLRLVMVVDGLDEVEEESDGANPLQRFLPERLPPGVKVLCASRPMDHLYWLEARDGFRDINLDEARWAGSNRDVVRQYLHYVAPQFEPPLTLDFSEEVAQRAEGNVLYAVMLTAWLEGQPLEFRRAELLPRGLAALCEESWHRVKRLPEETLQIVVKGLAVVAVAREALPLSMVSTVAGWAKWEHRESFLRVARPFLREEPWSGTEMKAWRFFHEYFRAFILSKLGEELEREAHRQMAGHLCCWPAQSSQREFHRRYVLLHGVLHWLRAGDWARTLELFTNVGYLTAKCAETGALSVEEDLRSAAEWSGGSAAECPRALLRAIQAESHVLKKDPGALGLLVYNRLRCMGWTAERIERVLRFPEKLPSFRLLHPVKTGDSERTLKGHEGEVMDCAVTLDGRYVVSASADKTLKVWEVGSGRELTTLEGHGEKVWGCAVTPDGRYVVSASADKTLKVWEVKTGLVKCTLQGHQGGVNGCAVTMDGQLVVSASDDRTLKVWAVKTGSELLTLKGHRAGVNGCAVTPDGQFVVSASADGTLKIWDLATGRELRTLEGHEGEVMGCSVVAQPDRPRVVSASADETLKVWEMGTGNELITLEGHTKPVNGCGVLPDGRVVSVSSDELLMVWDARTGNVLTTLKEHGGEVNGCAVAKQRNELRVVSASDDRTLKVWVMDPAREQVSPAGHENRVSGCAVFPDGRRVVSASADKDLRVWDVKMGQGLVTLKGHEGKVNGCAVCPDGRRVVSASSDGTLKVWEGETGKMLATLEGHGRAVNGCAILPDGRVVSASSDETLRIWPTGEQQGGQQEMKLLTGHGAGVNGCAVLPDGHVVSASDDGTLMVWDPDSGEKLATLEGHDAGVNGCAVLADGRVVSASDDETLKVWDGKTGAELRTLRGHTDRVRGCAVMPDGRLVMSASDDGTLMLWDPDSGKCLHTLYGPSDFLCVSVASDVLCAGDMMGSVWMLKTSFGSSTPSPSSPPPYIPVRATPMSVTFPKSLVRAYHSGTMALFVGSGLSLSPDVKGNFPRWNQLPERFIDSCESQDVLDPAQIQAQRTFFQTPMPLDVMLAGLGALRRALGRKYANALRDIFRPPDAAPGAVHHAIARLALRAILTSNYDPLIEFLHETPSRHPYTWKESTQALDDLRADRRVLLKVHGTAEHEDSVVLTEAEYLTAHNDPSYRAVLSFLLQQYTFLFAGYGINDPPDLDLVLKGNADAFKSAAQEHYALLKDPSSTDRDRYLREYNIRVIPYSDHGQLPAIFDQLRLTVP